LLGTEAAVTAAARGEIRRGPIVGGTKARHQHYYDMNTYRAIYLAGEHSGKWCVQCSADGDAFKIIQPGYYTEPEALLQTYALVRIERQKARD
jgi:hypothetical protein